MKALQDSIEYPLKPIQDSTENLIKTETKTSKSNLQKETFFYIESKPALKKHGKHDER